MRFTRTIEEAERIAMRLWLGLGSLEDVDRWAERMISQSAEVDPVVYDILEANREIKGERFTDFVHMHLGFDCVSRQGGKYAEEMLAELCLKVLNEEIAVSQFCHIVKKLDAAFTLPADSGIESPEGLVDLWDACDWCDDGWTLVNQPHLAEIIEAVRQKLLNRLSDNEG